MSVLATLGLGAGGVRAMLIDPPDEVLAEAGRLDPRPTVASSLQVAEPALQIAWWPQREELTAEALSKLAWMLSVVEGAKGWLVSDGDEESPTRDEVLAAVAESALQVEEEATLDEDGFGVRLAAGEG
ncbi:MAG: hypothetical protein OXS47_13940 [Chloroflexota bacterium]|nr:hypothetical protein [Chloroflexota bacterium]